MSYLKHGDIRAYLKAHPDDNQWKIVRPPMIRNWESSFSADTTSRTARLNGVGIISTHNWMALEWLLGGRLKKPCDIYAKFTHLE